MKKIVVITAIVLVVACMVCVFAACSSKKGLTFEKAEITVDYTPATVPAASTGGYVDSLKWTYDTSEMTNEERSDINEILSANGFSTLYSPSDYYYYIDYNYGSYTPLRTSATDNGVLISSVEILREPILHYGANTGEYEWNVYYVLYNAVSNNQLVKVKLTKDKENVVKTYSREDNAWYTVSTLNKANSTYSTVLYTADGVSVAIGSDGKTSYQSASVPSVLNVDYDVYKFANGYFRMAEKGFEITLIREFNDMNDHAYDIDRVSENYYYNEIDGGISIYDKSLNLLYTYYFEGEGNRSWYVLNNGNVLVQYKIEEMDESKDYTYIDNGKKYTLKHYLIDVEDKDYSKKSLDFYVEGLISNYDCKDEMSYSFGENVENIAVVSPIEDERLMDGMSDVMLVNLSNKLKIKGRIDKMIDNQTPGTTPDAIKDKLSYKTPDGKVLVAADGSVIGAFAYDSKTETYLVKNGKLYDYNLTLVVDFSALGYSIESRMNNNIIFSKQVEVTKYQPQQDENTGKWAFVEDAEPTLVTFYYRYDAVSASFVQIAGESYRLDGAQKRITTTLTYSWINSWEYEIKSTSTIREINATTGATETNTTTTSYDYYNEKGEKLVGDLSSALKKVSSNENARLYVLADYAFEDSKLKTAEYKFYRFA